MVEEYLYINIIVTLLTQCKDAIWVLSQKGRKIQVQRAQYNEFVESMLENQALMSWIAIIVDPNDNKVRIEKFYL